MKRLDEAVAQSDSSSLYERIGMAAAAKVATAVTSPSTESPRDLARAPTSDRPSDAHDHERSVTEMDDRPDFVPWETEELGPEDRADLSDDTAFMESLAALRASSEAAREQLAAFREYVSASRESARHDRRMVLLSLSISLVSLCIALISLLNQFGVI